MLRELVVLAVIQHVVVAHLRLNSGLVGTPALANSRVGSHTHTPQDIEISMI